MSVPTQDEIGAAYKLALSAVTATVPATAERDRAIDAATDALLWAIEHYRAPVPFLAFFRPVLRTFLVRATYRFRRKLANWREYTGSEGIVSVRREDGDTVSVSFRRDWLDPRTVRNPLAPAVADLAPSVAFVGLLYTVGGHTMREIADIRGCSPNTVMNYLNEAARQLATDGAKEKSVPKGGKRRRRA